MDKMKMESVDIRQKNIDKIAELFPGAITEKLDEKESTIDKKVYKKAVNFDLLRQLLSEEEIVGDEAYEFTWVGKKRAIIEANTPIRKTLRPCMEESKNWDNTENLYIEGDNLEVLKLLQESYLGKIKMIYIDPPYNTGSDFIYRDNFRQSTDEYDEELGVFDFEDNRMFKNNDTNGRFHSSWCSMIYSRLLVSKNLLSNDGIIFVSIDDNEVDNLRKICDEIFGGHNFIAHIIHKNNSMKNQSKYIGVSTEFVLIYCKDIISLSNKQPNWRTKKKGAADINAMFQKLKNKGLSMDEIRENIMEMYSRPKYAHLSRWNKVDEDGVFKDADLSRNNGPKDYTIINPYTGKECPIPNRGWGKSLDELLRLQKENMIWYGDENTAPGQKSYLTEESESVFDNFVFADTASDKKNIDKMFGAQVFEFPKSLDLIQQLIGLCTSENDLIMDFFSGSATTAHAVNQLNASDNKKRKFIMVQWPEECDTSSEAWKAGFINICEIGKERIRRAGEKILSENPDAKDLDIGFRVFKVDDSNMKDVYYAAGDYNQNILDMIESNIKEDRTDLDLLFSCILEWGMPLSLPYVEEVIDGVKIHNVADGDLIACFEENINEDVVKKIASREQKPLRVVFRDSSFTNSPAKINVEEIFKLLSPNTKIKVL